MTDADDSSNASPATEHPRSDGTESSLAVGGLIGWIVLVFAVSGLALGLVPMVYGSYGESQIDTPDSNEQDLTDEEETTRDAQFKNTAITTVLSFGPYLAVPLGIGLGFVAGVAHGGRSADVAVGVAAGTFVGVVGFVFLSSAVAMQQWWTTEGQFAANQRWLQWDSTVRNAALVAVPTALLAPIAGIAGSGLRR